MALYVDTSALLKRYLDEPDSDQAELYLLGDGLPAGVIRQYGIP